MERSSDSYRYLSARTRCMPDRNSTWADMWLRVMWIRCETCEGVWIKCEIREGGLDVTHVRVDWVWDMQGWGKNKKGSFNIYGSCGKNGPLSTILSFSKGLGLGCGFLVRSFHMIHIYLYMYKQVIDNSLHVSGPSPPVRLVRFSPDHFFSIVIVFIQWCIIIFIT